MSEIDQRQLSVVTDCYKRVGVRGDRSCPELTRVHHCHNCHVFAAAAEGLFDRPVDPDYLKERARLLAEPAAVVDEAQLSAVVFDVGPEAYALESTEVVEATDVRGLHRVPHRSNGVFRGLVNVQGQLELCFSLAGLLGSKVASERAPEQAMRVVVASLQGRRSVLLVDGVRGVQRFRPSCVRDVPATAARRATAFLRAILVDQGVSVGLLDAEALHAGLEGSLQ